MSVTGSIIGQYPQADGTLQVAEKYVRADGWSRIAMYTYANDSVDVDALLASHATALEQQLADAEASAIMGGE
jgi:hypothetical protein